MSALNKNTHGSIMIAALIITLVTGTLVGLFLQTVTQEVTNTHRARMSFQALNLAEAGVEFAMHAMIKGLDKQNDWTSNGVGYYRTNFPQIDISSEETDVFLASLNTRGSLRNDNRLLRVYVQPDWVNAGGKTVPVAIAEGEVRLNNGMLARKQIRVEMEKGSTRPWKKGWANGVLGKDNVTFVGGNVLIDSYISSKGPYDVTTNRNDNGSVASNAITIGAVSIGNADVIGRVATGGGKPDVGPNGSIRGLSQSTGTVDVDRIALDFYADLPDAVLPTLDTPETTLPSTFSASTLVPDSVDYNNLKREFPSLEFKLNSGAVQFAYIDLNNNGEYDPSSEIKYSDLALVSEPGYKLPEIDVASSELYLFSSSTTIVVDNNDFATPANTKISGGMMLGISASLEFYLAGSLNISGSSAAMINDTGLPPNLQIFVAELNPAWNTDVKLNGNGALAAAVYAPESAIELKGAGTTGVMYGAVVGETVFFNGNYEFHYDEDLANMNPDDDDDGKYIPVVTGWRELTHAGERLDWDTLVKNGL